MIERLEAIRDRLPLELILIVVDDSSSDGTADRVKEFERKFDNISLIERPSPAGIGSAYADGFTFAISKLHADYLGEIDADLQHPPEVLVEMCKIAITGNDVVIASRYVKGGEAADWSLGRKILSRGANALTRVFLRIPVRDSTAGFRVLSCRAVEALFRYNVSSKGYSFQVESLYAYKKAGMTFAEVPYKFEVRRAGETKLNRKEMWEFAKTTIRLGMLGLKKKS